MPYRVADSPRARATATGRCGAMGALTPQVLLPGPPGLRRSRRLPMNPKPMDVDVEVDVDDPAGPGMHFLPPLAGRRHEFRHTYPAATAKSRPEQVLMESAERRS
jgi:hypothetical protein